LKVRIAAEDRRTLRFRPPAVRRVLALAALLLLTLGLTWLAEPGLDRVAPSESGTLVARLTPHAEAIPAPPVEVGPAIVRIAPGGTGTDTLIALKARVAPAALQKELEQGKRIGNLPPPPAVSLDLRLHNPGSRELVLVLEQGRFLCSIDLKGPGVERVPVPREGLPPFAAPGKLRLPPGTTRDLRVVRLSEVLLEKIRYVYWTEPGRYTLSVRLEVPVEGRAAPLTVTTPPLGVQVEEAP
jgi:hypothetical protein